MIQNALVDVWPLAALLLLVGGGLVTIVRLTRPSGRRPISALHADQEGGVQSLSFVLTAPIFIMLMLLAVQITQVMIGLVTVHYAAYAAARSASVWIPARMDQPDLLENRIGMRRQLGGESGGDLYEIAPGNPKFDKIRQAAALACLPIAPSRDLGLTAMDPAPGHAVANLFASLAPGEAQSNQRLPQRLANKWAYAESATDVEIRVFHRRHGPYHDEPPLWELESRLEGHFKPNEIGWRDQIRVTVIHRFALLPGPGRLLARRANESVPSDTISPQIQRAQGVYWIPLSATATMVGEGEKSLRPYVHPSH
jgi:hypothetical protein